MLWYSTTFMFNFIITIFPVVNDQNKNKICENQSLKSAFSFRIKGKSEKISYQIPA